MMNDDEMKALKRAFAMEHKGRQSRRRRRQAHAGSMRAWQSGGAVTAGGSGTAASTTPPEPTPDSPEEMTLQDFIDGL
jgi:hypothetical protein